MTQDFATAVAANRVKQGKTTRPTRETPPGIAELMQPDRISAMVAWLCHKDCNSAATVHEAGSGYFAQLRWQRSTPLFATEAEGVEVRIPLAFLALGDCNRRFLNEVTCNNAIMQGAPAPEAIRDGLMTLSDFDNPGYSGELATSSQTGLIAPYTHIASIADLDLRSRRLTI